MAQGRILTSHRRKASFGSGGGGSAVARFLPSFRPLQMRHLLLFLCCISFSIYWFTSGSGDGGSSSLSASQKHTAQLTSLCPYSTSRRHVPTILLQGSQASSPNDNRTVAVLDTQAPGADTPAAFLPYAYPPKDLRFAQTLGAKGVQPRPGAGRLTEGVHPDDERGEQLCPLYRVPSSPRPSVPASWRDSSVMFGMSTLADRVLWNLPVWAHWLPGAPKAPLDPTDAALVRELPLVLVLTPPTTADQGNKHRAAVTETERRRAREAEEEANVLGMQIALRPREAERFETRYFALAEEMWVEAKRREADEGVKTEWFVFADDDTFFPDFDSLARLLSSHDSSGDYLIGALSESTKQVAQWGHIAYGGAGIIVSRGLLAKMNEDGVWAECLAKFGASFGGDAMVTHCAALATDQKVQDALTIDPTLHQLDIRGDGTGFFQSGFLITSLHHWGSWFTLFPPWHESGQGDLRKGVTLVGKAAKAVGGDNWGRRYVFEGGRVVVALGYSITVEAKPLALGDLAKSEHTWWEFETFHPIRPGQEEGVDKRTYYISGVRRLDKDGIFRLEHKNREGERVDIVWDQRATGKAAKGSRSRW
ncbi:hypothetical protein JCM3775_001934 [Rhodotorula graminis]